MDAISYKQKEYLYSYFRSKPPELNLHLHKYYEFLYFISGDATYIVEDNLYKIHPGDILLTKPGELHTIFFQSEKPYERIFMQIHPDFITEFDLFDKVNIPRHSRGLFINGHSPTLLATRESALVRLPLAKGSLLAASKLGFIS